MTQETLNIFLVIFLVVFTSCIVVLTYFFIMALKTVINVADRVTETAEDIKSKLQFRALAALPAILLALVKNFRKRG